MESDYKLDNDSDDEKSPEESLLYSARHGDIRAVTSLLNQRQENALSLDVNCRGVQKSNLNWTPLHLASYFGHGNVISALLEAGALINITNDMGDTALHRAAYTGRLNCVLLLLKHNANVNIKNIEGLYPKDVAKTKEIQELIEAAVAFDMKKSEDDFINMARTGESDKIAIFLRNSNTPSINCVDNFGNTALHWAAYGGHNKVAILLLQNGADPNIKNHKDQMPIDIAKDQRVKQILDVKPIRSLVKTVERYEGPLLKKSIMGWKPFWIVVDKGVLSLFKTRADATTGCRRKGCKYLDLARVESLKDVVNVFTIYFADKTKFSFAVELSEGAVVQRQKWENVLLGHITYAGELVTMGGYISEDDLSADVLPLGSMQDTLQTAEAHQQVMEKQIYHVEKTISQLADERIPNKQVTLLELRQQMNCVLSSSQEMCVNFRHCLTMFTQQEEIRKLQFQQEVEKSRVLEQSLHVLAEEHHELERSVSKRHRRYSRNTNDSDSDVEDSYFDCDESMPESLNDEDSCRDLANLDLKDFDKQLCTNINGFNVTNSNRSSRKNSETPAIINLEAVKSKWNGRKILPAPMISKKDFNVWSFLKQCVGKELSKITMPVIFNEPLSFLQRLAEYMEYAELIEKAVKCDNPVERLKYISAFAVSSSASNLNRVGKPFNPLLGETYEINREDLGYKLVCEQVSHHPPVSAFYVESSNFIFYGSIHPKLKFWGKSVEAIPKGVLTLYLKSYDEHYTWENIICCVHNIIVGTLWIEHYGTLAITNHKTNHVAVLEYKTSGWFGKDLHKIEGYICDKSKTKQCYLFGDWTEVLFSAGVADFESSKGRKRRKSNHAVKEPQAGTSQEEGNTNPRSPESSPVVTSWQIPNEQLLWKVDHKPPYAQQYYSFTLFAMILNELEEKDKSQLSPTDSRLRPDIRKMEEGNLDGASAEKHRLEEKQRASRKLRETTHKEWEPRWFKQAKHPVVDDTYWKFNDEFWDPKKRKKFPDIF